MHAYFFLAIVIGYALSLTFQFPFGSFNTTIYHRCFSLVIHIEIGTNSPSYGRIPTAILVSQFQCLCLFDLSLLQDLIKSVSLFSHNYLAKRDFTLRSLLRVIELFFAEYCVCLWEILSHSPTHKSRMEIN